MSDLGRQVRPRRTNTTLTAFASAARSALVRRPAILAPRAAETAHRYAALGHRKTLALVNSDTAATTIDLPVRRSALATVGNCFLRGAETFMLGGSDLPGECA